MVPIQHTWRGVRNTLKWTQHSWELTSFLTVQGSVLGPLLFVVYIDKASTSVLHNKIAMFVDDIVVYTLSRTLKLHISSKGCRLHVLLVIYQLSHPKPSNVLLQLCSSQPTSQVLTSVLETLMHLLELIVTSSWDWTFLQPFICMVPPFFVGLVCKKPENSLGCSMGWTFFSRCWSSFTNP